MRISTNTMFEAGMARMNDSQAKLLKLQQQISTGRRVQSPADDPVGSARALNLTQAQELNAQFTVNRKHARSALSQEEGVLQQVTGLIQDLKAAIVQAGNPALDNDQRKFIAVDLQNRYDELVNLANSRDGLGNYLFSGYQITKAPYVQNASGLQFTGDQGQTVMQIDSARQIAVSDSGDAVFDNVASTGTFVSGVAAGNAGSGAVSRLSVVDGRALTGHQYDIVFNAFATTAPMKLASSAAPANTGTASISPLSVVVPSTPSGNSYDIVFSVVNGATTYSVMNVSNSPATTVVPSTAYTAPQTIAFESLQVAVKGAPANGDTMTIRPSTGSGTYSVYDITLDPARAGIPVATGAYAGPQSIAFQGLQVTASGTPSPGDSFTIRPSAKQSLFTTLTDLVTLLQASGAGPVGGANLAHGLKIANGNIDHALDNVLAIRASVGSRLKELDSLDEAGEAKNEQYAAAISDIQDLDYNKALSDLTKQQIILEASQKSFTKISSLSLFNLL